MFDIVLQCYDRLRLITYRSMFRLLRERDGSLTVSPVFPPACPGEKPFGSR